MAGTNKYRTGEESTDLLERIVRLEERIKHLESGNRIGLTAVDEGGIDVNDGSIRIKDTTGNVIVEIGQNSDGTIGLEVFDSAGNDIIQLGRTADSRYGLRVNNTSGNPQIRAGQLVGTGGYGLETINEFNTLVDLGRFVFGWEGTSVNTLEFTSNTSYGDNLTTVGPSVIAEIQPTVSALVIVSAHIGSAVQAPPDYPGDIGGGLMSFEASTEFGTLVFPTDQNAVGHRIDALNLNTSFISEINASRILIVGGLAAGQVTFTAKYRSYGSNPVFFENRQIVVIPL